MIRKLIRVLIKLIVIVAIILLIIYGILWTFSQKKYPVTFGTSFSPDYAESLGLNWKEAYIAMLADLKPSIVRIAAPWNEVEATEGHYSYDDVDFMMNEAAKYHAKILLVIGQKIPRWPECYIPNWVVSKNSDVRTKALLAYVKETVNRYSKNPALEMWQVENEPFISFPFGMCAGYSSANTAEEVKLVHFLDSKHQVLITDSGELSTWYTSSHAGDFFGTTLYRVVRTPQNFIWTYGYLPSAVYKVRAWLFGKDYAHFFIAELQAEPWFNSGSPTNTSVTEQELTMSPARMSDIITYARYTGASRAYFWGVEWWYWMKTKQNDSSFWNLAKQAIQNK